MMKALIRKELRESLRVAVLGLVGFALLATWSGYSYSRMVASELKGAGRLDYNNCQPLLSTSYLMLATWLCSIFGAVLGWLQIHQERNRDLWGYLIHRPITRTKIFLSKAVAGLALYVLAVGLPLAGFVIWGSMPGHVAAPFEWGMAWPALKILIAGTAFYFAGMLTSLRQARWYVSRGFGLGLALAVVFIAMNAGDVNDDIPLIFAPVCIVVLAVAAWGSFLSHGEYRGQPVAGRLALTTALFAGTTMVIAFIFSVTIDALLSNNINDSLSTREQVMTRDGEIWDWKHYYGTTTTPDQFLGLDGKPVISDKTGKMMTQTEFYARQAPQGGAWVDFNSRKVSRYPWQAKQPFFVSVRNTRYNSWYYWRKYGRMVMYDLRSRRPVASLGPEGYAGDVQGNGERFLDTSAFDWESDQPWRLVQTSNVAYQVNLDQRTIEPVFKATGEETIGGAGALVITTNLPVSPRSIVPEDVVYRQGATMIPRDTNIIVVTRQSVHLIALDGRELLNTPYQPGYPNFRDVRVSALEPVGRYAVWFDPSVNEKERIRLGLHAHVTWLGANSVIAKSEDIPDLPRDPQGPPSLGDRIGELCMPLVAGAAHAISDNDAYKTEELTLALIGTAVTVLLGWWVGRRHSMRASAQIGWGIFIALFNLLGLLTFLCAQEWVSREKCPNCQKPRNVDREQCEHCGAEFAPAEKNGTEIFEPLGAG